MPGERPLREFGPDILPYNPTLDDLDSYLERAPSSHGTDMAMAALSAAFPMPSSRFFARGSVENVERMRLGFAADDIMGADRMGTALTKDDPYHRMASFLDRGQLTAGRVFDIRGKDGLPYTLLQTKGSFNGAPGIFEYIFNPAARKVSHQLFIPGGQITGKSNMRVR